MRPALRIVRDGDDVVGKPIYPANADYHWMRDRWERDVKREKRKSWWKALAAWLWGVAVGLVIAVLMGVPW